MATARGDHARAQCRLPDRRAAPQNRRRPSISGISADQAAAERIGHLTKFPSLEIGIEDGKQIGSCDNGYRLRLLAQSLLAQCHHPDGQGLQPAVRLRPPLFQWRSRAKPPKPAPAAKTTAKACWTSCSMTPSTCKNASAPRTSNKLDEYLTSVREIEIRLAARRQRAAAAVARPAPCGPDSLRLEHRARKWASPPPAPITPSTSS